jgi:hypothetical protein
MAQRMQRRVFMCQKRFWQSMHTELLLKLLHKAHGTGMGRNERISQAVRVSE